MEKPYIGVTGLASEEEVRRTVYAFAEAGYSFSTPHVPMAGFLVSKKTLGGEPTQNRRYPKRHDLSVLLAATEGKVLRMIHYNSREQDTLADQIEDLFDHGVYSSRLCRALQLNIVWPDKEQVARIKRKFPDMKMVFQASHEVTRRGTPGDIARGIAKYGRSIDYVLIDPSGGNGKALNTKKSVRLACAIRTAMPWAQVGFAGGFTGENVVERVEMLVDPMGSGLFCIDAESGLRDKVTETYGDDILNHDKVDRYIQAASRILR